MTKFKKLLSIILTIILLSTSLSIFINNIDIYAEEFVDVSGKIIVSNNEDFDFNKYNDFIEFKFNDTVYECTINEDGSYIVSIPKGEGVTVNIGYPFKNTSYQIKYENDTEIDIENITQIVFDLKNNYNIPEDFSTNSLIGGTFNAYVNDENSYTVFIDGEEKYVDQYSPLVYEDTKLYRVTRFKDKTIYLTSVNEDKYIYTNALTDPSYNFVENESYIYINNNKFIYEDSVETISLESPSASNYLIYIQNYSFKNKYDDSNNLISLSRHEHSYDSGSIKYEINGNEVTASINCTTESQNHTLTETVIAKDYKMTKPATNFNDEEGDFIVNFKNSEFGEGDVQLKDQKVPNTKLGFKVLGPLKYTYNHDDSSIEIKTNGLSNDGSNSISKVLLLKDQDSNELDPSNDYECDKYSQDGHDFSSIKIKNSFLKTLEPGTYSLNLIYGDNDELNYNIETQPTITVTEVPGDDKYLLCYHFGGIIDDIVEVHNKSDIVNVYKPNIPGYILTHWYCDSDFNTFFGSETITSADVTSNTFNLYAQFEGNVTVKGYFSGADFFNIDNYDIKFTIDGEQKDLPFNAGYFEINDLFPNTVLEFTVGYPFKNQKYTYTVGTESVDNLNYNLTQIVYKLDANTRNVSDIYSYGNLSSLFLSDFTIYNDTENTYTIYYEKEDPKELKPGETFKHENTGSLIECTYCIRDNSDPENLIYELYFDKANNNFYKYANEINNLDYIDKDTYIFINDDEFDYKVDGGNTINLQNKDKDYYLIYVDHDYKIMPSVSFSGYSFAFKTHNHIIDYNSAEYTWDGTVCTGKVRCLEDGEEHFITEVVEAMCSTEGEISNFANRVDGYLALFKKTYKDQYDHIFADQYNDIELEDTKVEFKLIDFEPKTFNYDEDDGTIKLKTTFVNSNNANFKVMIDDAELDHDSYCDYDCVYNDETKFYDFIIYSEALDSLPPGDNHKIDITIYNIKDGDVVEDDFLPLNVKFTVGLHPKNADLCIGDGLNGNNSLFKGAKQQHLCNPNLDIKYNESDHLYTITLIDDVTLNSLDTDGISAHNGNSINIISNGHTLTINMNTSKDHTETRHIKDIRDPYSYTAISSDSNVYFNMPLELNSDNGTYHSYNPDGNYDLVININDVYSETNTPEKQLKALIKGLYANNELNIYNTQINANIPGSFMECEENTIVNVVDSELLHNIYSNYYPHQSFSWMDYDEDHNPMPVYEDTSYEVITLAAGAIEFNNSKLISTKIETENPAPSSRMGIVSTSKIDFNNSIVNLKGNLKDNATIEDIYTSESMECVGIAMLGEGDSPFESTNAISFNERTLDSFINIENSEITLNNFLMGIISGAPLDIKNSDIEIKSFLSSIIGVSTVNLTYDDEIKHKFDLKASMVGNLDIMSGNPLMPILTCVGYKIVGEGEEMDIEIVLDYDNNLVLNITDCVLRGDNEIFNAKNAGKYKHLYLDYDNLNPDDPSNPGHHHHIVPNTGNNK